MHTPPNDDDKKNETPQADPEIDAPKPHEADEGIKGEGIEPLLNDA